MTVTVRVPAALRALAGGRSELAAPAGRLRDVLDAVGRESPALLERVVDAGALRRHVNVFVNDEDVRFRELLDTPVRDGDRVTIVPAIGGGW
ncbi:MAG: molybdopterin synthase sulfur carrier subunit [Proteobacteria bacterium]|nr:MAG: molybdopterin synthase sulfur carrier subunit [Pseudomonadota bacterium]